MKRVPFWILLCTVPLFALTEGEVIEAALKHSYQISMERIELEKDSISLEKTKDGLLPTLTITADGEVLPLDTVHSSTIANSSDEGIAGNARFLFGKEFAAGGKLWASVTGSGFAGFDSSHLAGSDMRLSFEQPLLRGGLSRSAYKYAVRHESILYKEGVEALRRKVIDAMSEVRSALLSLETLLLQIEIVESRLQTAQMKHNKTVELYQIGRGTTIDTLQSSLSLLRVEQELFSLQSRTEEQQSKLLYLSGIEIDTVRLSPVDFTFPPVADLKAKAMQMPEFSLFDLIESSFDVQIERREADKLPVLNAKSEISRTGNGSHLFDETFHQSKISIGLSGSFTVPLRKIRQDVALLKRSKEKVILQREDREAYLEYEITSVKNLWERELHLLKLKKREAAVAKELFTALSKASTAGSIERLEYENGERAYFEATMAVASQEVLLQTIVITIEKITGQVLDRYGVKL